MDYVTVDHCPMCHSKKSSIYYKGTSTVTTKAVDASVYACTSSGYGRFPDILKCSDCHLMYSSRRPTPKALQDIYTQVEDNLYLQEEAGRLKTFGVAIDDLNRFCPKRGKLFEIGSYTGVYLEIAKKKGWDVEGAEFSAWARQIALQKRGLKLLASTDELPKEKNGTYDAVVLWDVIEHVSDPNALIKKAADLLKSGGVIGVSTMVLDSVSAKLMRKKYPFLMEMHLLYFTRKTLEGILKNHGFEICAYQRHKRYVSLSYLFGKFPGLSLLIKHPKINSMLQQRFMRLSVGVRDVYARKKAI